MGFMQARCGSIQHHALELIRRSSTSIYVCMYVCIHVCMLTMRTRFGICGINMTIDVLDDALCVESTT